MLHLFFLQKSINEKKKLSKKYLNPTLFGLVTDLY